jgi:hypothetical protein
MGTVRLKLGAGTTARRPGSCDLGASNWNTTQEQSRDSLFWQDDEPGPEEMASPPQMASECATPLGSELIEPHRGSRDPGTASQQGGSRIAGRDSAGPAKKRRSRNRKTPTSEPGMAGSRRAADSARRRRAKGMNPLEAGGC